MNENFEKNIYFPYFELEFMKTLDFMVPLLLSKRCDKYVLIWSSEKIIIEKDPVPGTTVYFI